LWLNPASIWQGNRDTAMTALQQGLNSTEHAAFVEQLSRLKKA
jgi:hypothetical protein